MPPSRTAPGTIPATDGESLRSHLFGIRWPLFFQTGERPGNSGSITVGENTSPAMFTWRVITAANRFVVPAAILMGTSQIAGALLPVAAGKAVDRGIADRDLHALVMWCMVVIAAIVVNSWATRIGSRCGMYGMQTVQHRLRMTVTDRLLDPAGMSDPQLGGAYLSIATSDVFRLASTMQLGVYPLGELVAVLAGGVILFSIAWPLGLAVLLGAPVLLWIMAKAGHPMQRRSAWQQARVAAATGQAADLITGYRTIKGLRAEAISTARYRTVSQGALRGALAVQNSRGVFYASMNIVSGVFIAGLTLAATAMALHGKLSIGELISVVGVTQFMMAPLTNLPLSIGMNWATGVASAGRVLDLLRTPFATWRQSTAHVPAGSPGIAVHNAAGETIFHAESGEFLGVRAEGQAARDLVAALAAGSPGISLTTRSDGGETADVADVADTSAVADIAGDDLDIETYRSVVLTAPHSADLFDGTVAENLAVDGQLTAAVDQALRTAACTDIIDALPEGIDSRIGESGTRLSGGQRQRLALARALAAEPPVLVLHDPTTAVDAITAHTIATRLPTMRTGSTTVIVTGSSTVLAGCDRIVELTGNGVSS